MINNGKDENNIDKPWSYPVKFMVDNGENYDFISGYTKAIRVLPDISHSTTLSVNNIDTIMDSVTVASGEARIVQHRGGVFRSYHDKSNISMIKQSGFLISTSYEGDLGYGVYFTDLNLLPILKNQPIIAKVLRLINTGTTAPNGSIVTLNNPTPCNEEEILGIASIENDYYIKRNGFIDLIIDLKKKTILNASQSQTSITHPDWLHCLDKQYIYPQLPRPANDFTGNYGIRFDNNSVFYLKDSLN